MYSPAMTPEPPYYAVIFTSIKKTPSPGYDQMAGRMEELSKAQPGFLGFQSARGEDGLGITVSYWRSLEDIHQWKAQSAHRQAQAEGKSEWYQSYEVRICRVERQYDFSRP